MYPNFFFFNFSSPVLIIDWVKRETGRKPEPEEQTFEEITSHSKRTCKVQLLSPPVNQIINKKFKKSGENVGLQGSIPFS